MSAVEASVFRHPSSTVDQVVLNADGSFGGELASELGSKLDIAGGKILQVVSTMKTDTAALSTAATTETADITGLTATMTPSSTNNKILVLIQIVGSISAVTSMGISLYRNGSATSYLGDAAGSRKQVAFTSLGGGVGAAAAFTQSGIFLDSPSSIAALTYSIRLYNPSIGAQTLYINRSATDTDTTGFMRGVSTITLMEVSA